MTVQSHGGVGPLIDALKAASVTVLSQASRDEKALIAVQTRSGQHGAAATNGEEI